MAIPIVMTVNEQLSLAEAKAHLSEVIEGVESEHRRVVITKHGRPSAVVSAVADFETLEETLDLLSDGISVGHSNSSACDERMLTIFLSPR